MENTRQINTPHTPISVNLRIVIILSARYHSVRKGGNTMVEEKGVEHTDINKEDWEVLISFFPMGWREKAKELGAITRLRNFKDSDSLLRT